MSPAEPPERPAGRAYRGGVKRERPVFHESGLGPWGGEVKVVPLRLARGVTFEVVTSWTGPPAPGFPPSDKPVAASDTYATSSLELARALARQAVASLRRPSTPDLRELARILKARLAAGPYG